MQNDVFLPRRQTLTDSVRNQIFERISSGRWPAGYTLPNETELAALFSVSQGTVRRALKELVYAGILIRQQGKGTFVASRLSRPITQRLNWFVKNGEEASEKRTPHTPAVVSAFELTQATQKVASALAIEVDAPVWHISRDLTYEGLSIICCFDDIYLPQYLFPALTARDVTYPGYKDIYAFYEDRFGITVFSVDELARATFLNPAQAQKACVQLPYPAIVVQRISKDASGRPVEYRLLTNVTDEQNLVLSIERTV